MHEIDDNNTLISYFKEEVKRFVEARNWIKYHTPKNLVQAINCEAGELSQLLLFKDYTKDDVLNNPELLILMVKVHWFGTGDLVSGKVNPGKDG